MNAENLRTVKQLVIEVPWLTESALRFKIFEAKRNGLDAAIVRIGQPGRRGRVLIDREKFDKWIERQSSQREEASAA